MTYISRRWLLRATPVLGAIALTLNQNKRSVARNTSIRISPPGLSAEETLKRALDAGKLTVALMPDEWANYANLIAAFVQKYTLPVQVIDAKGNANTVLAALRDSANSGKNAPDVIDVPFASGVQAKREGLLTPYLPASWHKIPSFLKDAQGYWAGTHFGVLTFEYNSKVIPSPPQNWLDLLKPEYKDTFALAGDPRTVPLATNSVYSAALAVGGPRDSGRSGLSFFSRLKKAGTLLPTLATPATVESGKTPITFRWDYQALQHRDKTDNKIKVVIPQRGTLARFFVQGVNALAPNPYGARLWLDFLHSDEGQLLLLKGYARSTWFGDLARRGVIPPEQMDKLPPAADYATTIFPGFNQTAKALKTIVEGWA